MTQPPSRWILASGLVVVGLALAWPWARVPAITMLCFGLAALGLTVLMRAGQVSFGHAMYAAIGGYAAAFLARRFPGADAVVLVLAGLAASVVFGAVASAFLTRYRGIFFGMLNLGISMVLVSLIGKLYAYTGGTDGLRFERPTLLGMTLARGDFEIAMLLLVALLALAALWAVQRYFDSAAGQLLAAIKTNETRLEYIGVSARRVLVQGYVVSAALVGLSGTLLALVQGLVTPESGHWLRSGEYVFIAILGGSASALGAFVGAAVFEIIKLVAAAYFTNAWQILLGGTLIAVIFFAPEGLTGARRRRAARPHEQQDLAARPRLQSPAARSAEVAK
jgi:ABC-type branched-subunit amino acid transport system permease subunit